MDKIAQSKLALIVAAVGSVAFGVLLSLGFVFPGLGAVWSQEGQALSVAQQILMDLSVLCQSGGLILLPLLLAAIMGCYLWAILSNLDPRVAKWVNARF